jgi:arsenate reductase
MKIYFNPRCSKCREALCIIEENGVKPEVIEYLDETPSARELREVIHLLGVKPHDIIRTGEEVYKTKFKGKDLSDEEWIQAMIENPILIERPIIVDGDRAVIGRPPVKVLELLK